MSLRQRQSIAAGVLAAIVITAVLLIATSGEEPASVPTGTAPARTTPASTTPAGTTPAAGQRPAQGTLSAELEACFEDNGVDDPGAALQHPGTPSPELTRAFEACERFLPRGQATTHSPRRRQPSQP